MSDLEHYDAKLLAAALEYHSYGWAVIPIPHGSKNPGRRDWQHERIDTPAAIRDVFSRGHHNISVLFGEPSNGLVDMDLDVPSSRAAAAVLCPPTPSFGRPGAAGSHKLFLSIDQTKSRKAFGHYVDLRSTNHHSVMPPSYYDEKGFTGERYWEPGLSPSDQGVVPRTWKELESLAGRVAAASILAEEIEPGARHDVLLSVTGMLMKLGWQDEEIEQFIRAILAAAGEESRDDYFRGITTTRSRLVAGEDVTGITQLEEFTSRATAQRVQKWLSVQAETAARQQLEMALTDEGNAARMYADYGDILRYNPAEKKWYVWDGRRWERRYRESATHYMIQSIKKYAGQASGQNAVMAAQHLQWSRQSLMGNRIRESCRVAGEGFLNYQVELEQLDANPYLINFTNGTYDLSTNELRPHDPGDLLTHCMTVPYDENAPFTVSQRFLEDVFEGSVELIDFVQRLFGYALFGEQSEAILPIFYGTGRNGKSTLLNVMQEVFGDYAVAMPSSVFFKTWSAGEADRSMPDLAGARFAYTGEGDEDFDEGGAKLSESRIKTLTGGDYIVARRLYAEAERFKPGYLLVLAANNKPIMSGNNVGIKERVKLVPFNVRFLSEPDTSRGERLADPHMASKLKAEYVGWGRWLVEGWRKYCQHGLAVSEEVRSMTMAYQDDMDVLADWIAEYCEISHDQKAERKHLWESYSTWEGRDFDVKPRRFDTLLELRGFNKRRGNDNKLMFYGIGLRRGVVPNGAVSPVGFDVTKMPGWAS